MTQKRAKLSEGGPWALRYINGKWFTVSKDNGDLPIKLSSVEEISKSWYYWCYDQETVDMANIYLKLLED